MSQEFGLKNILGELDRAETHIVIRSETRKWSKPVTVIQGLEKTGRSIQEIAHILKSRLATGGTVKDGVIILQGDQRSRVKEQLVNQGFPADHIEVF
jgi:translation initiation factor 1